MKRTPRRQRARAKAWVYLVLFGPEEDTDEGGAGSSTDDRSGEGEDERGTLEES